MDRLWTKCGLFPKTSVCPWPAPCPKDKLWTNTRHEQTLDKLWLPLIVAITHLWPTVCLSDRHLINIGHGWTLDNAWLPLVMPMSCPWPTLGPLKAQPWPSPMSKSNYCPAVVNWACYGPALGNWACCGCELGMACSRSALGVNWAWSGRELVLLWVLSGCKLRLVWPWIGPAMWHELGLLWAGTGSDLGGRTGSELRLLWERTGTTALGILRGSIGHAVLLFI